MLMKDFRKLISPTEILELRSKRTEEPIKECKASELSEDDMNLTIDSILSSTYFNDEYKASLGMFILFVYEV